MNEDCACMVGYELVPVNGKYPGDDGTMQWAEPDVQQAAGFLKRLRDEPEYYKEKAEKGKAFIEERLSMKACAEAIKERMSQILG